MSRRQNTMLSRRWAGGGNGNTDYTLLPLTFKCLTGGVLSIKNENGSYDRNFEYSLNDGSWTAFSLPKSSGVLTIATLSPGDTISFRRDNDNFYQAQFVSDSNLTFDIYGNLLSLQYGSAFNGQTSLRNTNKQAFGYTFMGTNVVDASKLMLTATTLSAGCYKQMFSDCENLILPPSKLPATTLAQNCYGNMFKGTKITVAPELPATTLVLNCYTWIFKGCSQLSYVKCLATDGVVYNNCAGWLDGVSPTGTFVKAPGVTWPSGAREPNGWTVIEATE